MTEKISLDDVIIGIGVSPIPDDIDFKNIDIPELTPSERLGMAIEITKRSQGSIDLGEIEILAPNEMDLEEIPRYYDLLVKEFGENYIPTRNFKNQAHVIGIKLNYGGRED